MNLTLESLFSDEQKLLFLQMHLHKKYRHVWSSSLRCSVPANSLPRPRPYSPWSWSPSLNFKARESRCKGHEPWAAVCRFDPTGMIVKDITALVDTRRVLQVVSHLLVKWCFGVAEALMVRRKKRSLVTQSLTFVRVWMSWRTYLPRKQCRWAIRRDIRWGRVLRAKAGEGIQKTCLKTWKRNRNIFKVIY